MSRYDCHAKYTPIPINEAADMVSLSLYIYTYIYY